MTDAKVKVIYVKEMRNMINYLKRYGLNSNGIIFGGLVRDEIIGTYYRQKFIDNGMDFSKYWDYNYDFETNYRLILPCDMDIYFKNNKDSEEFIAKITGFVSLFHGVINIANINNGSINNTFSYTNDSLNVRFKHTKITIIFYMARTFTFNGIKIEFTIDVIVAQRLDEIMQNNNSYHNIDNIEPPFYNLDFLCNVFVMEKINGNVSTRISNCTGTRIDDMVFAKKTEFANNIIKNMIMFKTEFTRNVQHTDTEYINCYRIIKMINRKNNYYWCITNLPFIIFNKSDAPFDIDTSCSICLEDIKINEDNKKINYNDDDYVSINSEAKTPNNILHYNCFINYLRSEQQKKYRNPTTNCIECRCPFRNPFNFKDCHKLVSY